MNRILTCGLFFNLHRESPDLSGMHNTYYNDITGANYVQEKMYPWKGSPLFMEASNPHPPWSLAWSQLPLYLLPFPHPSTRFPASKTFIYIQMTLTCPLLLSGTRALIGCTSIFMYTILMKDLDLSRIFQLFFIHLPLCMYSYRKYIQVPYLNLLFEYS